MSDINDDFEADDAPDEESENWDMPPVAISDEESENWNTVFISDEEWR